MKNYNKRDPKKHPSLGAGTQMKFRPKDMKDRPMVDRRVDHKPSVFISDWFP
jgi:hypothetical protein